MPLPPGVRLITEEFRDAGYFLTNCSGLDYSRRGKTDYNFDPCAGVDIGGDFPLYGFNLYTSRRALCPELFVKIELEPGETQKWTRSYRFFSK